MPWQRSQRQSVWQSACLVNSASRTGRLILSVVSYYYSYISNKWQGGGAQCPPWLTDSGDAHISNISNKYQDIYQNPVPTQINLFDLVRVSSDRGYMQWVWYGMVPLLPRQCVLSLRVVASCSVHPVSERHRQAVQSALALEKNGTEVACMRRSHRAYRCDAPASRCQQRVQYLVVPTVLVRSRTSTTSNGARPRAWLNIPNTPLISLMPCACARPRCACLRMRVGAVSARYSP
jgi:hypothetical protein